MNYKRGNYGLLFFTISIFILYNWANLYSENNPDDDCSMLKNDFKKTSELYEVSSNRCLQKKSLNYFFKVLLLLY